MGEPDHGATPELGGALLAPAQARSGAAASIGLIAVALATTMIWLAAPDQPQLIVANLIPRTADDLGTNMVMIVDPSNRAAVAAAAATLRLPEPQRQQIEQSVLQRERRLGWIVLTDSMDPDGDTVTVEASGIVQHVVLTKAWVPVAVPLEGTGPIVITGVRDGGGGGITVALGTRGGSVALRIMLPGERVEVMP